MVGRFCIVSVATYMLWKNNEKNWQGIYGRAVGNIISYKQALAKACCGRMLCPQSPVYYVVGKSLKICLYFLYNYFPQNLLTIEMVSDILCYEDVSTPLG